jgi:hypothetical protein
MEFQNHVPSDILLDNYLLFISLSERDLISLALNTSEPFCEDIIDRLVDFYSMNNLHHLPKKEDLKDDLLKLAHYKLIQEPMYALSALQKGFTSKYSIFESLPELKALYEEFNVTTTRFLNSIDTSDVNTAAEEKCWYFFHTFIRSLDNQMLKKLLRFITGVPSFTCCNRKIYLSFSGNKGLTRAPHATVCSKTLIFPTTYNNYSEFKEEFMRVLLSNESYLMLRV